MSNFKITAVFNGADWRMEIFGKHRVQLGLLLISADSSANEGLAFIYNPTLLAV